MYLLQYHYVEVRIYLRSSDAGMAQTCIELAEVMARSSGSVPPRSRQRVTKMQHSMFSVTSVAISVYRGGLGHALHVARSRSLDG